MNKKQKAIQLIIDAVCNLQEALARAEGKILTADPGEGCCGPLISELDAKTEEFRLNDLDDLVTHLQWMQKYKTGK